MHHASRSGFQEVDSNGDLLQEFSHLSSLLRAHHIISSSRVLHNKASLIPPLLPRPPLPHPSYPPPSAHSSAWCLPRAWRHPSPTLHTAPQTLLRIALTPAGSACGLCAAPAGFAGLLADLCAVIDVLGMILPQGRHQGLGLEPSRAFVGQRESFSTQTACSGQVDAQFLACHT